MTRLSRMLTTVLLTTVSLVAIAGCSPGGGQLEGTRWKLSEWTVSSLDPADFAITVAFADGLVSGSSGVNTCSGSFKVADGRLTLYVEA